MRWFCTLKRNAFSQGGDGYLKAHDPPPPPPPERLFLLRREVTSAHWK